MIWILAGIAIISFVFWVISFNTGHDGARKACAVIVIVSIVLLAITGITPNAGKLLCADSYDIDTSTAHLTECQEIVNLFFHGGSGWIDIDTVSGRTVYRYGHEDKDGFIKYDYVPADCTKIVEIKDGSHPRIEAYEVECRLNEDSLMYSWTKVCLFFVPEHISVKTDTLYAIYVPIGGN